MIPSLTITYHRPEDALLYPFIGLMPAQTNSGQSDTKERPEKERAGKRAKGEYSINRYSAQLVHQQIKPQHPLLSLLCPRPKLYSPADVLRSVLLGTTKGEMGRGEYRNYLTFHEFGSEGLDFWITVQGLKRGECTRSIIEAYLLPNSPQEINIDDSLRRRTIERLRRAPRDHGPLKGVQMVVFELLESSFIRFLEYLEHKRA